MFSVTPPPKAAPRPSLFGLCIRITRIMRRATIAQIESNAVMRIDMGTGNMPSKGSSARNLSNVLLHPVPDGIEFREIGLAQFLARGLQFLFHPVEPPDELARRRVKQGLGVAAG